MRALPLLLLVTVPLSGRSPAQAKIAPPTGAALLETLAGIRKDPLHRKDQAAFATKLRKRLGEFQPGAVHYGLLLTLAETNESLGKPMEVLATLDRIAAAYEVTAAKLFRKPFERIVKRAKAKSPEALDIALRCIRLLDDALAARQLDSARAFQSIGARATKKSRVGWLRRASKLSADLVNAFTKLAGKPDGKSLAVAASFYLNRGAWPQALPLLAKLGDASLAAACARESAGAPDHGRRLALARAWETAATRPGLASFRQRFLNRAEHWLGVARNDAKDDDARLEIDRLLEAIAPLRHGKRAKKSWLADMDEELAIIGYDRLIKGKELARGTMRFNDEPIENGLFTHPTDNAVPTRVGYALKGRFGSLHGAVAFADSGAPCPSQVVFEVFADGRRLWRSKPVDRGLVKRAFGFHLDIPRVQWLELRVRCLGSSRSAHAVWLGPYAVR